MTTFPWPEPIGVPRLLIASPNHKADNEVMLLRPEVTPYLGTMKVDSGPHMDIFFILFVVSVSTCIHHCFIHLRFSFITC